MTLRLGVHSDALARIRAESVATRLGAELVATADGQSLAELHAAVAAGELDAVLRSAAIEAPTAVAGLVRAAVLKRTEARDALCTSDGRALTALETDARVGVSSPLRRAQLLSVRDDLDIVEVSGAAADVRARLASDDPSERLDAVVLAGAELEREERDAASVTWLGLDDWPTAPAQGALAIDTRAADQKRVAKLDHRSTRLLVDAECGVYARLDADVRAQLAASALFDGGLLFLSARVYAPGGARYVTASHALYPEDERDPAAALAERATEELRDQGAAELVARGGDAT